MVRHIFPLLVFTLSGLLAANGPAVQGMGEPELEKGVKDHINERMYGTCKAVVLKRETDSVYRGYAEFLNGIKIDLEVSVTDGVVEYRFLKRPESPAKSMQTRLDELEMLATRQEAEIARLRALCQRAGIDANPPGSDAASAQPLDANNVAVDPVQDDPTMVFDTAETVAEPSPRYTWQVYENIQKGMSYGQVVDILGDDGDLISGSQFDNAENEVYVWTNPDDSHLCVVFRNGTVLVRTQFGLPETAAVP